MVISLQARTEEVARAGEDNGGDACALAGRGTLAFDSADPASALGRAQAFRYQRLLDEGRYASISEMAVAERIERGYVGSPVRLTLLAPAVVGELTEGRAGLEAVLPELLRPFPEIWEYQREAFVS